MKYIWYIIVEMLYMKGIVMNIQSGKFKIELLYHYKKMLFVMEICVENPVCFYSYSVRVLVRFTFIGK